MPINVTCPSCHARFSVAEKFAGKTGPCPKCKGQISIPKLEDQVVIHAPEHSEAGAVGAGGRHVLKTYKRKETKFAPLVFTGVAGFVLVTLLIALVVRTQGGIENNSLLKILGAIALGPPIAWAGYTFLRDDELEAYRGVNVVIRALVCGLIFALMWGIYAFLGDRFFGADAMKKGLEIWQMLVLCVPIFAGGTLAAYASFDLDPGSAFFSCGMYFAVTVILRLVAGASALPGLGHG